MVEEPEKKPENETRITSSEVIIEALKGIKSEILVYAIAIAALFVSSSSFGIDVLRETKWPLLFIFSVALVAYFIARAIPQARVRLGQKQK